MSALRGWRLALISREAVRNLTSATSRGFVALALAVFAGSATGVLAHLEARDLQTNLERLGTKGRNVLVISSSSTDTPARITRASCERATRLPGVERAGVLVSGGRGEVFPFGDEIPLFRVSTTLLPALENAPSVTGSALTTQQTGSVLRVRVNGADSASVVGGRQPPGVDINSGLSIAASVGDFVSPNCVAVLDMEADAEVAGALILAQLESDGPSLMVTPALRESTDVREAFLQRPSRYVSIAVGILIGALIGLINLGRSAELAVYRFSGTSRIDFLILLTLESGFIAALAATASAASTIVLTQAAPLGAAMSGRSIALGAGTLLTSLPFAVALAKRQVSDLAKDR